MKKTLREIQQEQMLWAMQNFPGHPAWHPLLGVVEEIGELAHSHLKQVQGIRNHEDHDALAMDAVGDAVIYLMDYCTARGWDLDNIINNTWEQVRQRDWNKNPNTAHKEVQP